MSAKPGWESPTPEVTLHFVMAPEAGTNEVELVTNAAGDWARDCQTTPMTQSPLVDVVRLDEVTAAEYRSWSDLHFEHLSP